MNHYKFNNLVVHTEVIKDCTTIYQLLEELNSMNKGYFIVDRNFDNTREITICSQGSIHNGIYFIEEGYLVDEITLNQKEFKLFLSVFKSLLKTVATKTKYKDVKNDLTVAWLQYFNKDTNKLRALIAKRFFEQTSDDWVRLAPDAIVKELNAKDKYTICYIALCAAKKIHPIDIDKKYFGC